MATVIRIAIALIVLGFLFLIAELTNHQTTSIFAFFLIAGLWGFALALALLPAIAIYAPEYNSRIRAQYFQYLIQFNPSKPQVLGYICISYLMTIYLFAVIFRTICNFDNSAFKPTILSLSDAAYFSVVTIATVGFGDILPATGFAKLLVSIEILTGVAYGVFFLSVIASFLREA